MRSKHLEKLCVEVVVRHTTACLVLFGVSALFLSIVALRGFSMDTSVDGLMLVDDPERARSEALKSEYSNDEVIIVAFDLGRVFEIEDLQVVDRLTEAIEYVEGVEEVIALTNIEDVRGTDVTLDASPLVNFETLGANELALLHTRVRGHRLYERNLVSPDLDVLSLVVVLEPPTGSKAAIRRSTEDIRDTLSSADLPWPWHLAGFPVNESEADRVGLRYMHRAGYDPRETVRFWQNMAAQSGPRQPEFLSTHPSPATRIADLQREIALLPPRT